MARVFVYGTLKKGNEVRGMDKFPGAEYIGSGVTKDPLYDMLDLGSFPGVIISKGNDRRLKISGQVFEVTDELFKQLDQIEGYPMFYNRMEVATDLGKAWMYYLPNEGEYLLYKDLLSDQIQIKNGVATWL